MAALDRENAFPLTALPPGMAAGDAVPQGTSARRQAEASDVCDATDDEHAPPNDQHQGLLLVGLFKLSKALFFASLGAGALHLVHHSLADVVMRVTDALPIDPEGRFVGFLLDKSDLIDGHQLRQISMASFGYAAICVVEGTGLLLGRTWAEYFTVILTVLGLPIELFEMARHFTWFKLGALVVNLFVLLYLLWILKRKRAEAPVTGVADAASGK